MTALGELLATAEQLSPERAPEQALELNQRILKLDPDNAAAHVRLARAYQAERQFAAAALACAQALRIQPESRVAHNRLQRINEEWELARLAEVCLTFDDAFQRGVAAKDQELVGEAIAYLWRAVELSKNRTQSILCHTALAAAYRVRKDARSLELAAAQYELVLKHAPGDLPAMTGLAAVFRDQGELSQARRLYEEVLRRDPHNAHARLGIAGVLADLGVQSRARPLVKRPRSGPPPDGSLT